MPIPIRARIANAVIRSVTISVPDSNCVSAFRPSVQKIIRRTLLKGSRHWERGRPARIAFMASRASACPCFVAQQSCGRDARAPSDLPRTKPCATERPVFRPGAQFGFDRIVLDVPDRGCEMFRVANVAIEILFKPELPAAAQHLVRFMRSVRLERV